MKNSIAIVLIVVSILGGYFYIYPTYVDMTELQAQQEQYQAILDQIRDVESRESELKAEYAALSDAEIERIETLLPDEINIPLIVLDLDEIAGDHLIDITKVETEFQDEDEEDDVAIVPSVRFVDIKLTLEARASDFRLFMEDVEDNVQIMNVVEAMRTAPTENGSDIRATYLVTLRTYYLPK